MGTWNNLYESTPRQGYNPGYGAREFQGLKARTAERVSVEHIFGQNETDSTYNMGIHKEGSGRILVVDEGSSSREDLYKLLVMGDVGRLKATLNERPSSLQIDDDNPVAPNYESDNYAKIDISTDILGDEDVAIVSLFDYDRMVNKTFDESIGGIKEFTLKARVQDHLMSELIKDDIEAAFDLLTPEDVKNVLNLDQLRTIVAQARDHNLFFPDSYNVDTVNEDGIDYVNETIQVNTVRAQNVYGAVWG